MRAIPGLVRLLFLAGIGAGAGLLDRNATSDEPRAAVEPPQAAALPDGRPLGGRLRVEPDSNAALRADLPWSNASSLYGWGSVRVVGRPLEDELMVRVIIDAPAAARRWQAECDLRLVGDEGAVARSAHYVGRPMEDGAMYDAIRLELPIEDVRRLAAASSIEGSVCGDPLLLGPEQLATLRAFLVEFDARAMQTRPPRAIEVLRAPEDPLLEEEEILEDAG